MKYFLNSILGSAVLVVTATDVDKTGASYYGEQTLQYISTSGESSMIQLGKKRSTPSFSRHHQYIVKQTGDENKENHQLGDIVLMYNQILRTEIKRNVWQPLRRKHVLILILTG